MMRGKKNLSYRNELGQEVVFDNRVLFLEAIDMIGTPGIHTAESLAMSDGQRTIRHQLGPKTIPCSFAVKDVGDVEWLKNRLTEVFFPKLTGTMTVLTMYGRYEIDCYPLNVPTFRMAENDGVWRFDVDFVADYPYWRVGDKKIISFSNAVYHNVTIKSYCPYSIPIVAYLPANESDNKTHLYNNGTGLWLTGGHPALRINTKNFEIYTKQDGQWVKGGNQYISGSDRISNIEITYGTNTLYYEDNGAYIEYYDLSMGEI